MHLTGGDGFATMADGYPQYIFSFADLTGTPDADVMEAGTLAAPCRRRRSWSMRARSSTSA